MKGSRAKQRLISGLGIGLLMGTLFLTGCSEKSKITLGEYKGLTYTSVSTEVSDSEIEAALKVVVTNSTTYTTDESRNGTAVVENDLLLIDYEGTLKENGASFDGGTANDQRLEIGSGKFIAGFEDALIGKTVGEKAVITITFPTNYAVNPDLAGKEADFSVNIKAVQIPNVPELTDALIEEYTEGVHKTIDSYKAYCTDYLKQQKEADAEEAITSELLDQVMSTTTFEKIDKDTIDEYYESVLDYYQTIANHYETSLETYVSYYYDQTMEEFYESVKGIAEETVKEQLVLDAIIEKENLTLSEEQYKEMITTYMEQYDYTDQKTFENDYTVDKLRQSMLYDLAIAFIRENATEK